MRRQMLGRRGGVPRPPAAGSTATAGSCVSVDMTLRSCPTRGLLTPSCLLNRTRTHPADPITAHLAGATGLEPATTGFGDRDSAKLSYAPSGTDGRADARPDCYPAPVYAPRLRRPLPPALETHAVCERSIHGVDRP